VDESAWTELVGFGRRPTMITSHEACEIRSSTTGKIFGFVVDLCLGVVHVLEELEQTWQACTHTKACNSVLSIYRCDTDRIMVLGYE